MIVAITGGTGFIGRRLVERHLAVGDRVRVLSRRDPSRYGWKDRVEYIRADLGDDSNDALTRFAAGAEVLYHCAGEIHHEDRMHAVHVEGTRRLIDAATGRIGRWVQLSSVGAYGRRKSGVVDESTPPKPCGLYEQTKLQSDELVAAAAGRQAFTHVILRPSIVFGPGMPNRSLIQMIAMIDRRLFFFIGSPGASVNGIFVDNVAEALLRCGVQAEAAGQTFNLSDWCTLESFVGAIADSLGAPTPRLRLPEPPVRWAARIAGRIPGAPLTESRVDALCCRTRYPTDRIEQVLGYSHPISMKEGIARLVADFRRQTEERHK